MKDFIVSILIGFVLIVIGISNTKGNINSLHHYHRKRVASEDVLPFGKLVGLGTILCGLSLVFNGGFLFAADYFSMPELSLISNGILILGVGVGLALNFYAMIKYNHGIF